MKIDLPDEQFAVLAGPLLAAVAGEVALLLTKAAASLAEDRAKGLMDKEDAAAYLGLESVRALEDWMKPVGEPRGRGLPHNKIGETVRFSRARIDAWLLTLEKNTPPLLAAYPQAA